ncbi:MAG: PIN domain-containing protein [Burkholderiaceae bacterium]|nr:PIN domain-containing protein [Burkholderiaceae bacterium]
MAFHAIVLDANILVRAVLGSRVSRLLADHVTKVSFLAPAVAFDEVREHLPAILAKRGQPAESTKAALDKLAALERVVVPVPAESYLPMKDRAMARIGGRDPDDWPVLACALAADCPIWTEDSDFFGAGVATWTTSNIELFLAEPRRGRE